MLQIDPNARTTPAVRVEITRSTEPSGVLARRFGVSSETIRKWRRRGPADCLDHSTRPHRLPWKATDDKRAIVCALRRATHFALNDLTFGVTYFLPHRNRHSVWRILRAEGLHYTPRAIVTGKLCSDAIAKREILPGVGHRQSRHLNDRAEVSHQPTRRRERQMQRFRSARHARRFLSTHSRIPNHFQLRCHRLAANSYRQARGIASRTRGGVTETAATV
jgi:transposase